MKATTVREATTTSQHAAHPARLAELSEQNASRASKAEASPAVVVPEPIVAAQVASLKHAIAGPA